MILICFDFFMFKYFLFDHKNKAKTKYITRKRPILVGFSFFLSIAQPGMDGFTNVMKRVDVMDHRITPWVIWCRGQKVLKPQASSSGVGASSDASGGPKM